LFYFSSENEEKMKKADLDDAIADFNSAEIKTAMADSDLKGLTQIKSALDDQNTKNAVEFFHHAGKGEDAFRQKSNSSEISLAELSEEFKEAQQGGFDYDDADEPSSKPQKVKIVLHIPDSGGSKNREKETERAATETIQKITENAEQFFTPMIKTTEKGSKRSEGDAIKAAEIVQKLIQQDGVLSAYKPTTTSTASSKEGPAVIVADMFKTGKNIDGKNMNVDDGLISKILNSKAFQRFFAKPTDVMKSGTISTTASANSIGDWKDIGSSLLGEVSVDKKNSDETTGTYKAFVKNIHEQALNSDKFQGAEGTLESFAKGSNNKLRINGGKVLGGSVRGGTIIGGTITGGDVSGGEIDGGSISGGTFKGGTLMAGSVRNGIIEGGKIRGGNVEGGLLKSGLIDGGLVKGGIIEGGHLINGTIEGGDFKGGEMVGGKLVAGEIDGGILKGGTVAGGTLKGGVIESGRLEGGVMLSGLLRGGVVKSGVIRGGVIDKGVVVQDDAEIGPGVEIHEGVVKGGKITVSQNSDATTAAGLGKRTDTPSVRQHHTIVNRSNVYYHIELDDSTSDGSKTLDKEAHLTGSPQKKDVTTKMRDKHIHSNMVHHTPVAFVQKKDMYMLPKPVQHYVSKPLLTPIRQPSQHQQHQQLAARRDNNSQLKKQQHTSMLQLQKMPAKTVLGSKRQQVGQQLLQPQQQQQQTIQLLQQPQQTIQLLQQPQIAEQQVAQQVSQLQQQMIQQYARPSEEHSKSNYFFTIYVIVKSFANESQISIKPICDTL